MPTGEGEQVTNIEAVERDGLTGWVKLRDAEGKRERFACTSKDTAQRLAVLLGVPFVPMVGNREAHPEISFASVD